MKKKYTLIIISLLTFLSCSSKKNEGGKEPIPIPIVKKAYQPETICDCSEDGIKILKNIYTIRNQYSDLKEFQNDEKSFEKVSIFRDNWTIVRDKCIRKFATKLFQPGPCNNPDKIHELRKRLDALGVRTS